MAKMSGVCLIVCLAMLLSCLGCGPRNPPRPQPANLSPVEPGSEAPAATNLPEASPASPDAPSDSAPPSEATAEPTESPAAPAAATNELLHESFADVAGSIRWNKGGVKSFEGPPSNRTIYFFNGMPEGGPLVMRAVEDDAALGPDEQPGVLALSWQEIPPKLPYSGFNYLGGRASEDRLTLPPLKLAKAASDLAPFRLKFRHKDVNRSRTEPIGLTIGCRFEPQLGESYAKRIDLGTFTATGEWGSFEMSLAEGQNAEAFLTAIASENPACFKIIWAQSGPLTDYRAGDTLLIDDIVITRGVTE